MRKTAARYRGWVEQSWSRSSCFVIKELDHFFMQKVLLHVFWRLLLSLSRFGEGIRFIGSHSGFRRVDSFPFCILEESKQTNNTELVMCAKEYSENCSSIHKRNCFILSQKQSATCTEETEQIIWLFGRSNSLQSRVYSLYPSTLSIAFIGGFLPIYRWQTVSQ